MTILTQRHILYPFVHHTNKLVTATVQTVIEGENKSKNAVIYPHTLYIISQLANKYRKRENDIKVTQVTKFLLNLCHFYHISRENMLIQSKGNSHN